MRVIKVSFAALLLLALSIVTSFGQENYGLSFNSFNVSQENRTSVEIGKEQPVCLDSEAELSFEFRFLPNRSTYYGYIFRLINNAGQNIDLIYNPKDDIFNVVGGASFTDINFRLPKEVIYDHWTKISFRLAGGNLACFINDKLNKETKIALKDHCFRLIFGACHLRNFSTTDVPPMQLRNIGIKDKGKLHSFWSLDNTSGDLVVDSLRREKAYIINPLWAGVQHRQWKPVMTLTVKGNASYSFDPLTENLKIISEDSIFNLPLKDQGGELTKRPSVGYHLFQGNLSLFNTNDQRLYNYYIDNKGLAQYNPETAHWSRTYDTLDVTAYGHASRIFIPEENALYIFGGYGQLRYKNEVQRIDFNTKTWTDITTGGDYFSPRYMAGIGRIGDSIYILGGYGSHDGDQRLNPQHYYDLMLFNLKTRTFKKIYTLPSPAMPFVPVSSLVMDKAKNCFYTMVYDENRFDTKLQLIKCSLTKPTYEELGDAINYSFKDVVSEADLFYCAQSRKLVAITELINLGSNTVFNIYSIDAPPGPVLSTSIIGGKILPLSKGWTYGLIGGILLLGGILWRWWYLRKVKSLNNRPMKKVAPEANTVVKGSKEVLSNNYTTDDPEGLDGHLPDLDNPVKEQPLHFNQDQGQGHEDRHLRHTHLVTGALDLTEDQFMEGSPEALESTHKGLRIYLFGTFEMLSAEGEEISQQFSPLLKELFLMILLFTIKDGKGISTERINDIFWGNKTGKNAKNNLSVNMVRLKSILSKAGDIFIKKEGSRWVCDYSSASVRIDLVKFWQLISSDQPTGIPRVRQTLFYIARGAFLRQTEYRWLDEIKAEVNNKAIDELLKESETLDPDKDVEYMIEIANNIFHFDPLNEDALQLKCKSLYRIGRHSLAKNTYERFAKEFHRIYEETFSIGFNEIVR
jgi:DNA-binding SARP family transcriptional activator